MSPQSFYTGALKQDDLIMFYEQKLRPYYQHEVNGVNGVTMEKLKNSVAASCVENGAGDGNRTRNQQLGRL